MEIRAAEIWNNVDGWNYYGKNWRRVSINTKEWAIYTLSDGVEIVTEQA